MTALRICFAGTPPFAAGHLQALIEAGHHICAVYTQPDRRAGRGKRLQASAVKQLALAHALPVRQPASLRGPEAQAELAALQPDLLIVVAYGLLLPEAILAIPKHGCINVHASLLPRWRGAAPIERALLAGDTKTGVTIMLMDAGLDTGPILRQEGFSIRPEDTREDLESRLIEVGKRLLLPVLDNLDAALRGAVAQDDRLSTYAGKLDKKESAVDWQQPAQFINRQIRAALGRFPAFTVLAGERLRLLDGKVLSVTSDKSPGTIIAADRDSFTVASGSGSLQVARVQLPGKKAMTVREINNARPDLFQPGRCFASADRVR